MPQLEFGAREALLSELHITWKTDHRSTDRGTLDVSVIGASKLVLARHVSSWSGTMVECTPDALRGAMEAYLWGNGSEDITSSIKRLRRRAQEWQLQRHMFS